MSRVDKSLVGVLAISLSLAAGAAVRQAYAPRVLATGRFHQVAHKGEGVATILQWRNGRRVLRLTEFRTADKPELTVLLISASDAFENQTVLSSRVFALGQLQQTAGDQEYELPGDLDVMRYGAITIWSQKYEVNFTTAPLRVS